MTRKGGQSMKAVKKNAIKVQQPVHQKPEKKLPKVVLTKDAGSFLKQRMGKKVRDLRLNATNEADSDAMTDGLTTVANLGIGAGSIEELQASALQRGDEFERDAENAEEEDDEFAGFTNTCREAENTRRRFFVELRKVLSAADIIIEVLDARDPGACRCDSLEREVLAAGKRLVLLVNKIDLVPKHAVEAWMKHLQRSFPTIAFKSAHGGAGRVTHAMTSAQNASDGLLRSTHAVVGADEVMQLLKNYSRMGQGGKTKAHVSVGIVGYPNVGKSSVINSMKRHGAVETGGKAGVTKIMQEVQLDSKVTLIDCPGVVFEGDSEDPDVVLRNVVRVESVQDPVGVVEALLKKAPREAVQKYYNLQSDFASVQDFLTHIAQVRGKLRRGSGLDIPSTARSIITDWTTGKFRYYAMPPAESSVTAMAQVEAETAEVVTQLAPALDIDALFNGDASGDKPNVLGAPRSQDDDDAMDDGEGGGSVHVDI